MALEDRETVGKFEFINQDGAEMSDGSLIVYAFPSVVGLVVSLSTDGDYDLFLSPSDCERLIALLQEGMSRVRR